MPDNLSVRVWTSSLPSREHPERNEDRYWVAANKRAFAVIDGMGSGRRIVAGQEIGGEHAAAELAQVLDERLQDLPGDLAVDDARKLLAAVVAEAGERIYNKINAGGQIKPEQIPAGKTADEISAAAVMTALILCEGGRRAVIGQNGDTRAYLYSGGELMLLSEDQDAVELAVLNGQLAPEMADQLQVEMDSFDGRDIGKLSTTARSYFLARNLLFGQIGDSATTRPPDFSVIQLQSGDMLALVSDGVYANLTTAEIGLRLRDADPALALVGRAEAFSALRALPDPGDAATPYNYRAHQDDATALVISVAW